MSEKTNEHINSEYDPETDLTERWKKKKGVTMLDAYVVSEELEGDKSQIPVDEYLEEMKDWTLLLENKH
jgi:hypothetical protein